MLALGFLLLQHQDLLSLLACISQNIARQQAVGDIFTAQHWLRQNRVAGQGNTAFGKHENVLVQRGPNRDSSRRDAP